MSIRDCALCSRPVRDGYVCHPCTHTTRRRLRELLELAAYADDKRARFGTSWRAETAGRSAEQPLPYDPRVTAVLAVCSRSLRAAWAAAEEAEPARVAVIDHPSALASWLTSRLGVLRKLPEAGLHMQHLQDASDRMRTLFDRPPDRIYVGLCRHDACTEPLYANQDHTASVVACPRCEHQTPILERREELAAGVENYLGTVKEISRLLRTTLGDDVSERMIRSLSDHGLIQPRGSRITHDKLSRPRESRTYRIGDVREAVATMRANRDTERAVRRTVRQEQSA